LNFRSGAGLAGEHPLGYQLGQLVGIAGQGEFQSPDPVHSQSNRAYRGQLVLTLDLAVELADPFEMGRTATVYSDVDRQDAGAQTGRPDRTVASIASAVGTGDPWGAMQAVPDKSPGFGDCAPKVANGRTTTALGRPWDESSASAEVPIPADAAMQSAAANGVSLNIGFPL